MYKLYDFDARGLAEPLRLLFVYSGTPFEDVRAPCDSIYSKLPPEIKGKCPWGDVPLLETGDGKKLAQSLSIGRYLSNKFGLRGSNDFEAALTDEYVDTCQELFFSWMPLYFVENDKEKLAEKLEEIKGNTRTKYLKQFNEIILANGGQFTVGKSITWADIYLAHNIDEIKITRGINFSEEYEGIRNVCNNVFSNPKIKEWIEKRPKTVF